MGKINKWANLYDQSGTLIEKAPIKTKFKQEPPHSTKYPGSSFSRASFHKAEELQIEPVTEEAL